MAKDKKSRSRKSSGKGSDSASRDSSPPSSAPAPGTSSDQEGNPQAESTADEGTLAQNPEMSQGDSISQDQIVSEATEVPVLTDDAPLNSPQIEPALGAIVEDPANDRPAEDVQSPTDTEQSDMTALKDASNPSPTSPRPLQNLATELGNQIIDSSEEDSQREESNQSTPRKESLGADPEQRNPSENQGDVVGSSDARSGQIRELEEEKSQRLAAEERVKALEAKLKDQEKAHEGKAAAEKKKFERDLQKAHQATEAEKTKYDEKFNENDEEIKGYQAEIERLQNKEASLKASLEKSGKAAADDAARIKIENEQKELEMRDAIQRELNSTSEAPLTSPRDYPRPGSARFLLAEYEYLLDKFSPLYQALRNAANYADGRGDWTREDKQLLEAFGGALGEVNTHLEESLNMDIPQGDREVPQKCLAEARTLWGAIAQANTW